MKLPAKLLLMLVLVLLPVTQAAAENIFRKTLDDLLDRQASGADTVERAVPTTRGEAMISFAPVVRAAAPSVVNVYAARRVRQRSPFEGDPFFERFFGRDNTFGRPRERIQKSLGSGVIVSQDGIILTNHHVIAGMTEVKIALHNGAEYECEIILQDEKSDLAVLRISDGGRFDAIDIANSDTVETGDLVLAIGNPFGVGQTVTSGIVSATARSHVGINDLDFFIQTDAAINPGNSGGALVDMKGRLVGINTAIFSRSGGSIGIGFAIPSNMAKVIIRSALSGAETVERPWIGADFQNVTADIAETLGMRRPGGVLVTEIYPDGPADRSGLERGDVVVGINERILENVDELGYRLDTIGVGGDAQLVVISNGERKLVSLQLQAPPELTPRRQTLLDAKTVLGGATIANLSPAVAHELGLSTNRVGVVVVKVEPRSRAAQNGVRRGDIVRAINGVEMDDVADVRQTIKREPRGGWQVALERGARRVIFERNGRLFRQYVR